MKDKKASKKPKVEKEIKQQPKEKIFRYKRMEGKYMENRSFKESEMTNEDFTYFYRQLGEAYNKVPFAVKVYFLEQAGPRMKEFLEKDSTKLAVAAGQSNSDLSVVN